jgi:hypothetical protein
MIKITSQLIFIVFCIFFLYLFLTQHNLNFLYKTILGRMILFLFIIFCVTINPLLGVVISAIVLYYYNNAYLEQMSHLSNSLPSSSMMDYSYTVHNIYETLDILMHKLRLEKSLMPKQSNRQIVLDKKYHRQEREPSAYGENIDASYF